MGNITLEQNFLLKIAKDTVEGNYVIDQNIIRQINWEALLTLSIQHKMFLFLYKLVKEYVPDSYSFLYKKEYESHIQYRKLLIQSLCEVNKLAQYHNIPFVSYKGLYLSLILYNDPYLRDFNDIDILAKEIYLPYMNLIVRDCGFIQPYSYKFENESIQDTKLLPFPVFKLNYMYPEYYQYFKTSGNRYVKLELQRFMHTESMLTNINRLFENTESFEINKESIRTLSLNNTFLVLCENTYANCETLIRKSSKTYIRDFMDIYIFLQKYKSNILWHEVVYYSNLFKIFHQVSCVLKYVNEIFDYFIDDKILNLFDNKNITYNYHCKDGALLQWKRSIIERLFNPQDNRKEQINFLKKRYFSNMNTNFCNQYKMFNKDNNCISKKFIKYIDKKYKKYKFSYFPEYDNEFLYFSFLINNNFFENFNKYRINIMILDESLMDTNTGDVWRFINIEKKDGILSLYDNNQITNAIEIVEYKEDIIICIKTLLKGLYFNKTNSTRKLCYNISLYEKVYEDVFQCIGRQFETDDSVKLIQHPGILIF